MILQIPLNQRPAAVPSIGKLPGATPGSTKHSDPINNAQCPTLTTSHGPLSYCRSPSIFCWWGLHSPKMEFCKAPTKVSSKTVS